MKQINAVGNHGLIIRHLRLRANLSVRMFAERIEKSAGWISEIETGRGNSRLSEPEFNRIVEILDGGKHRQMFKIWVATYRNCESIDTTFDGAVLKFIRTKRQLRLKDAATKTGFSVSTLSKIESGISKVTLELRNKIMVAYGYSPSSFKNLSTDPVRSKAVPLKFKLDILIRRLSEPEIESVYKYVQNIRTTNQPAQT